MGTSVVVVLKDVEAKTIGDMFRRARHGMIESVMHLLECGQRLIAVQEQMGRGDYCRWLEDNREVLGFGRRNAFKLMAAARKCHATPPVSEEEAVKLSRAIWGNPTPRSEQPAIESSGDKTVLADFDSGEDDEPGDTPEERRYNAIISVSYSAAAAGRWLLEALLKIPPEAVDTTLARAINDAVVSWTEVADQLKE